MVSCQKESIISETDSNNISVDLRGNDCFVVTFYFQNMCPNYADNGDAPGDSDPVNTDVQVYDWPGEQCDLYFTSQGDARQFIEENIHGVTFAACNGITDLTILLDCTTGECATSTCCRAWAVVEKADLDNPCC